MHKYILYSFFVSILFTACGGGGGSSSIKAPTSMSGKVYKMTISSGTGLFGNTGEYTIITSSKNNTYISKGDANINDSGGTYTYSASGNNGIMSFSDSTLGNGAFLLSFTSINSGTFTTTILASANSKQFGSFSEI